METVLHLENILVRGEVAILKELAAMKTTHVFDPLPAYNVDEDMILPKEYEARLKGATIVMTHVLTK